MLISNVFMTRKCPRKCNYCNLRDASDLKGSELTIEEWREAFYILEDMGCEFIQIAGNEPLLFGDGLRDTLNSLEIPYAILSSAEPKLFEKNKHLFIGENCLKNYSVSLDYPISYFESKDRKCLNEEERKSLESWEAALWIKENNPNVEVYGCMTFSKKNLAMLYENVVEMLENNIFPSLNLLHYNMDGEMGYLCDYKNVKDILIGKGEIPELKHQIELILSLDDDVYLLDNARRAYLKNLYNSLDLLTEYFHHCGGEPFDGPTIDADGYLRCCAYRRGTRTPKFSIFDLQENINEWKRAVFYDALECPGCYWECNFIYKYSKMTSLINEDSNYFK
jgi:MoaA/NifB/PqqE/SkfB family radical SAM enzyme